MANNRVISPLQQMHDNAMRKLLGDKTLRIWLYAFLTEDCHVGSFDPVSTHGIEISVLQRLGNLLLRDLKECNLSRVHKAECEYRAILEENQRWHEHNYSNPFTDTIQEE